MNQNDEIRRRLSEVSSDEPPATLLQNIQNEIPEDFAALAAKRPTTIGARWWQVAAMLVVFIGVGFFAWQASRDPLSPDIDGISVRTEPAVEPQSGSIDISPAEPTTQRPAEVREGPEGESSDLFVERAIQETTTQAGAASGETGRQTRGSMATTAPAKTDRAGSESAGRDRAEIRQSIGVTAEAPHAPMPSTSATNVHGGVVGGIQSGIQGGVQDSLSGKRIAEPKVERDQSAQISESITITGQHKLAHRPPPPVVAPSAAPSTGGTAEPNDQPYGDVFFRTWGTNPFIDTEDDRLSTFGLDVDTGSYTVARRYLSDGHVPPPEAIRAEEFINSFNYGDPAPRRENFAIRTEGGPWPYLRGERYYGVRIGIRGREVTRAARKAATLIFTVDVSGSMAREDRLGLVKQSLQLLLDQLDRGDRIGLVVYGSRGEILLEPTSDHEAIRRAIDRLQPGGATNAEEGLLLAYEMAGEHFRRDGITRVILCSDGVANVGRTGPDSILARIGDAARRGIELTTVGFGMGNYNDHLMEQLANRGNGQYAYVDTLDEARRVFVENLTG
ncbi:MAG: VWA domain-containing protein, partial [Thermoanaerobaculia bacterium]